MQQTQPGSARRACRSVLGAALVLCLGWGGLESPQLAEAGIVPTGETHRDKVHKFSMKILRDYVAVPKKADEETVVAAFADPKAKGAARGTLNTTITVVRVRTDGAGPVVTGGSAPPQSREEWVRRMREANRPKTAWDATVGRFFLRTTRKPPPEELPREPNKKIKSKDKPAIPGELYHYDIEVEGWRGPIPVYGTLAIFKKDDIEYGIWMVCAGKLKKNYKASFNKIAKSFKWFDSRAKDVESLDILDGVNITARRRREIERSMVEGWDVVVSPKKNYIILYNTDNGRNKMLAKEIAIRIERIREQIYEVQFPPSKEIKDVSIVRVCKDRKEYLSYGAPPGSAGYWSPMDRELVFYDASRSKKIDTNTLAVLYHEAFHQYIFYSVGNVSPHSWFNEGHGDYYAGAEYKARRFKIKPFQWRQGTIKTAVTNGPREAEEGATDPSGRPKYLNDGGYTPLKDFVRFTQREYYSYAGVSYAQGWSLIYFFREVVPKNKRYKKLWGGIADRYFDILKTEVNRDPAFLASQEEEEEEEDEDGGDEEAEGDSPKDDAPKDEAPKDDAPAPKPESDGEGETPEGEEESPEDEPAEPPVAARPAAGYGPAAALKRAVDEAFKDVDWEALEEAWKKAVKSDM